MVVQYVHMGDEHEGVEPLAKFEIFNDAGDRVEVSQRHEGGGGGGQFCEFVQN